MRPRRRAGMVYGCGLRRCLIIFAPHTLVLDRRTRTCRAPSPRLILRRSKNFTSGAAISFTSSGPIVADRSRHHRTPDPTPGAADAGPRQRGHPHGGERRPHTSPPLLPPSPRPPVLPSLPPTPPPPKRRGTGGGGATGQKDGATERSGRSGAGRRRRPADTAPGRKPRATEHPSVRTGGARGATPRSPGTAPRPAQLQEAKNQVDALTFHGRASSRRRTRWAH